MSLRYFSSRLALFAAAMALEVACAAVYPELQTPLRPAEGKDLEAPPSDLRWIAFKSASVPAETRDGRKWGGDLGHAAPDPYAILFLNGKQLLKTPVQTGTLTPTWPDGPAGNFRIKRHDRFRVELWDSKAFNDHPIGMKEVGSFDEAVEMSGAAEIECDTGAQVIVAVEPAHARVGFGFYYELRIDEVYVTRVYEESPAGRAGLKPGDQILALDEKPITGMKSSDVQSILNTPHVNGLAVRAKHKADGQELSARLKDGAVFPLFSEAGTLR